MIHEGAACPSTEEKLGLFNRRVPRCEASLQLPEKTSRARGGEKHLFALTQKRVMPLEEKKNLCIYCFVLPKKRTTNRDEKGVRRSQKELVCVEYVSP